MLVPRELIRNFTLDKVFGKGASKVRVLGQGGACYSAPNGPNNLKCCIPKLHLPKFRSSHDDLQDDCKAFEYQGQSCFV